MTTEPSSDRERDIFNRDTGACLWCGLEMPQLVHRWKDQDGNLTQSSLMVPYGVLKRHGPGVCVPGAVRSLRSLRHG